MMRIGVNPGQWGWEFEHLELTWRQAERLGFGAISCFDHITAAPRGLAAWDAPSVLTAIALSTERTAVCVNVIDVCLRHPFLLAGQLAVAQAASRGRLEVGLGTGATQLAPHDFRALSKPFPPRQERVATLARMLEVLPALWRGETVTDDTLGLDEASLGRVNIDVPPIVLGGHSRSLLELAVRHADGWNAVVSSARQFTELNERLDATCAQIGRTRALTRTAQVFLHEIEPTGIPRLVHELAEAGADTTLFVLVKDQGPAALDQLAAAVIH